MPDFVLTDPLQIPRIFASSFEITSRLGFIVFSGMFIAAILHENLMSFKGAQEYEGLFLRIVLVISLLIIYERFFTWVVEGLDLISRGILPQEEFKNVLKEVFKELIDKKDLGKLNFFIVITALNYLTYALAFVMMGLLVWLRFIFLSLLYIIGPILVGASVYKQTAQGLGFWLRSLISVSLWNVVLSALMKVISTMNITSIYAPSETNQAAVLAANFLFIVLFVSVPLISHQITSRSGSISGIGSAVIGIATAYAGKYVFSHRGKKDGSQYQGGLK
jgi:MFS family permease